MKASSDGVNVPEWAKLLAVALLAGGGAIGVETVTDSGDVPISRWRIVAERNCERVDRALEEVEGVLDEMAADFEDALEAQRSGIRDTLYRAQGSGQAGADFVNDALGSFPLPEIPDPVLATLNGCESVVGP